ncbi:MAG: nuclear transport factor 2 family protein [Gemmatimonadetes bacterium]|nr:nuclear transport factor 2 family protein [Gemmatimonadota bacterium]
MLGSSPLVIVSALSAALVAIPPLVWRQDTAAEVAVTVERFHRALQAGDSSAALELLTPDAVILEGGGGETVAEYRAHHLPSDIAFAQATTREPGTPSVSVRGDVAWVASVGRVHGEYRGRTLDLNSAELMVLTRTESGWRISAVHWSSRSRAQ